MFFVLIVIVSFFCFNKNVYANKFSCQGVYSIEIIDQSGVKVEKIACPFNINITDNDKVEIVRPNETINSSTKNYFTCAGKSVFFYNENVTPSYKDFSEFEGIYLSTMLGKSGEYDFCPKLTFSMINGNYYVAIKNATTDSYFPDAPGGGDGEETKYDYIDKFILCEAANVLTVFKVLGIGLNILKILIPVVLIIMGSITFAQAIMANNQDAISKAAVSLGKKVVIGVAIFFIPTVLSFVFKLINNVGAIKDEFSNCITCMEDANECNYLINTYSEDN